MPAVNDDSIFTRIGQQRSTVDTKNQRVSHLRSRAVSKPIFKPLIIKLIAYRLLTLKLLDDLMQSALDY